MEPLITRQVGDDRRRLLGDDHYGIRRAVTQLADRLLLIAAGGRYLYPERFEDQRCGDEAGIGHIAGVDAPALEVGKRGDLLAGDNMKLGAAELGDEGKLVGDAVENVV